MKGTPDPQKDGDNISVVPVISRWRGGIKSSTIPIKHLIGNYCGPYWSDGRIQSSVVGESPALDDLDLACKKHDAAYATHQDIDQADSDFIEETKNLGLRGKLFSKLVEFNMSNRKSERLPRFRGELPGSIVPRKPPKPSPGVKKKVTIGTVTSAPISMARKVSMKGPKMSTSARGTVVTHKEYVGTVSNSTSFNCVKYPTNPGLVNAFPWLNQIGNNYDQYRFRRLRYTYVSSSSTATSGRVTLAFNYNALDEPPASKQQIFSIAPNTEDAVWNTLVLDVPCTNTVLYTRQYLPPTGDLKTYDMGTLLVASDLGANTSIIGELYVEYVIEFMKPHPQQNIASELYATNPGPTTIFKSAVYNGTRIVTPVAPNSTNEFTISAPGRFLLNIWVNGTVINASAWSIVVSKGSYTSVATGAADQLVNSTATKYTYWDIADITVDNFTQNFQAVATLTATTVTEFYLLLTRLDSTVSYY
jgi:hypothetical protein